MNMITSAATQAWGGFPCKVCERGTLIPKKVYRMSAPVVVIGYIFLIPCILGIMASSALFFYVIVQGASQSIQATSADVAAGVGIGSAVGIGVALFWGIACFVGGLLGWLLVMKKRVLQCSTCAAVVNAS